MKNNAAPTTAFLKIDLPDFIADQGYISHRRRRPADPRRGIPPPGRAAHPRTSPRRIPRWPPSARAASRPKTNSSDLERTAAQRTHGGRHPAFRQDRPAGLWRCAGQSASASSDSSGMSSIIDAMPDYEAVVAPRLSGPHHPPQLQRRPDSLPSRGAGCVPCQARPGGSRSLRAAPHQLRPQRRRAILHPGRNQGTSWHLTENLAA